MSKDTDPLTRGRSNNNNGGQELTQEESLEFSDTLRSLETTMKRHMSALAVTKNPSTAGALTLSSSMGQRGMSRLKREATNANGFVAPTRTDKVTLFVRIVFLKVGEIDTLRDRFGADAFIQTKWREPAMDGKLRLANEEINWDLYWNPKISVENAFGEPKENIWYAVSFDAHGMATVTERRRLNGSFLEYMELNQFPFDTQDLTVTITSDREEHEVEFVEDHRERCALNVDSFVDEQEWKLHKYIHVWTRTREEAYKNNKNKHPCFSAATKASRRPEFFIWNILVVMFLICSLSFATFSVDIGLPQNRLQLSFILLLTTVSFKFVVNQSLPMIAYLTYLDKYILSSMGILCCICIWHAIVAKLASTPSSSEYAKYFDYGALAILLSIYLGFHLIFLILVICLSRESRVVDESRLSDNQELNSMEDEYDESGVLPESYNEVNDAKAIRNANITEHATNQQAVMSAWQ